MIIMCLAWWNRAHERYLKDEKAARKIVAGAAGVLPNFSDLPDHDPKWLNVVNDVAFVMKCAQDCDVPTSRGTKRKCEVQPATPRKKPAVRTAPRKTRSKA